MNIKQTKLESITETSLNIFTGMLIAITVTQFLSYISPHVSWLDVHISVSSNGFLTFILTIASFARTYFWRRFFTNRVHKSVHGIFNKIFKNKLG